MFRSLVLLLLVLLTSVSAAGAINISPWPGSAIPPGYSQSSGASTTWQVASDSTYDAPTSLKANPIADNQRADIETTLTTGGGTMSFARRVSSEAGYDFLRFYIDGTQVGQWSGDVAWDIVSFTITAGSHTFRWSYQKDASDNAGLDTAWIDAVVFPEPAATTPSLSVTKAGTGSGAVTSSPGGIDCGTTCAANFAAGTAVTLTAFPAADDSFGGWSGSGCSGTGTCVVTVQASHSVTATFTRTVQPGGISLTPGSVAFGGQSMNTTSPPQTVTIGNSGSSTATISSIATSAEFAVSHNCGALPAQLGPGASCAANVTFTPAAEGGRNGTLSVQTATGTDVATLSGVGERSLVTHYYLSILRRAPDSGGKAYWDGEAARVQSLGVSLNELWYAMAMSFYTSPEYLGFGRDNTGFVTDLYNTFFNRPPDSGGRDYWVGLLQQGLPREAVLASFMFSPEFASFTQAIFGPSGTRREVDTVVDFYRGILSRLPDNSGFNYWLQQFRTAQCQAAASGSGAPVYTQVESISSAFVNSPENSARGRTNAQFVSDMYNAFLRRGGDLGGVQYWIDQIASGARTRDNVRQQFLGSPEFNSRVQQIIAAGCAQ